MKIFSEMSLKTIRAKLSKVGVVMNDDQFNSLTYSELKKVYKMSKKAYHLYEKVDSIINKKTAPTPEVPLKGAEVKANETNTKKIIKGA